MPDVPPPEALSRAARGDHADSTDDEEDPNQVNPRWTLGQDEYGQQSCQEG